MQGLPLQGHLRAQDAADLVGPVGQIEGVALAEMIVFTDSLVPAAKVTVRPASEAIAGRVHPLPLQGCQMVAPLPGSASGTARRR